MGNRYGDLVFDGSDDPGQGLEAGDNSGVCPRCGWPSSTCSCEADGWAGEFRQPRPALSLWYVSIAVLVSGLVLTVGPFPKPAFPIVGWLLVGPVAVLVYGQFMQRRTAVSSMAGYGEPNWLNAAVKYFPVVVIVAVAVAAWPIADWVGRQ